MGRMSFLQAVGVCVIRPDPFRTLAPSIFLDPKDDAGALFAMCAPFLTLLARFVVVVLPRQLIVELRKA